MSMAGAPGGHCLNNRDKGIAILADLTLCANIVRMTNEARTEALLAAAYTCFTRHGVRRTTMDDIASEAGMSRSAAYQYIRNTEHAFRSLTARLLDSTLAAARAAADSQDGLAERFTAVLAAKLELTLGLWRDSPAHAAELLGADARISEDLVGSYNTAMRDLLADIAGSVVPRDEALEVADVLLALTRGVEADLADPEAPARRLRRGVTLLTAGLTHQLDTKGHT
jgi:AcrR family transcriptional regulator